ncbi:MAG: histidine phosphatase family protein [Pseudomonadota bacterium]
MTTLILYRHAKSSWASLDQQDHERPLNARGQAAAPVMGQWLAKQGLKPDLVISSDAVRTRETLALTLPAFEAPLPDIVVDEHLYLASPELILERIKVHAGRAPLVMVVGHNPGLHVLSLSLDRGPSADVSAEMTAVRRRLAHKFPTAAVAVFDLGDLSFGDDLVGRCALAAFMTPKQLQ